MTSSNDAVIVLNRALDQMGDVLTAVHEDHLARPTPCTDWNVGQLVGHVLAAPERFLEMARGEEPDWSAATSVPSDGSWAAAFRSSADDLIHHWHQQGGSEDAGHADWQTAEFAVHAWDLSRAIGRRADLDPEVAERALAFMSQGLTPDNRGAAFGPEQEAPADASPHDRLAAYAGRSV